MNFDEYFMNLAEAASERGDCLRRRVGACLVDQKHRVQSLGYNGTRPGAKGCIDGACPRGQIGYDEVAEFTDYNDINSPGYCIANHAELSALLHANTVVDGMTMYVNHHPCNQCKKMLFNSGLKRVVFPGGEFNW